MTTRASDIPYRFARTHEAAQVVERWSALAPGEESGEIVGVAGRIMLSRPQGKLAFAELRDASGSVQLFALAADDGPLRRIRPPQPGRLDRRHAARWCARGGASCRSRSPNGSCWPRPAATSGTSGTAWPTSRPGIASARSTCGPTNGPGSCSPCGATWSRPCAAAVGAGLRRGRDPHPPSDRRRGDGPTLHHPSQHVGYRPVSQGGARAVPQATRRRRLRQGLRDRPQLPQRGHLAPAQSRVHHARALPGLRRLQRHHGASSRSWWPGWPGTSWARPSLSYGGRELDLTPPWRRATLAELITEATGLLARASAPRGRAGQGGRPRWASRWPTTGARERSCWRSTRRRPRPNCGARSSSSTTRPRCRPLARRHRDGPDLVERYEPVVAGRELGNGFSELIDPDDQRARVHRTGCPPRRRRRGGRRGR